MCLDKTGSQLFSTDATANTKSVGVNTVDLFTAAATGTRSCFPNVASTRAEGNGENRPNFGESPDDWVPVCFDSGVSSPCPPSSVMVTLMYRESAAALLCVDVYAKAQL